eukprot:1160188-Pelagomonas_calceolata.AAC.2
MCFYTPLLGPQSLWGLRLLGCKPDPAWLADLEASVAALAYHQLNHRQQQQQQATLSLSATTGAATASPADLNLWNAAGVLKGFGAFQHSVQTSTVLLLLQGRAGQFRLSTLYLAYFPALGSSTCAKLAHFDGIGWHAKCSFILRKSMPRKHVFKIAYHAQHLTSRWCAQNSIRSAVFLSFKSTEGLCNQDQDALPDNFKNSQPSAVSFSFKSTEGP